MPLKVFPFLILLGLAACSSYKQFKYITDDFQLPSQNYKADFNQTWKATLEVMKKYDLQTQDLEAGIVKTRWIENTQEMNFVESVGGSDAVKAAKYMILLNVVKGFRSGREVAKVTIRKRQLVEQDFLTGWKEIPSDGIQEKIILYRIGRLIKIDNELRRLDRLKEKEELSDF